MAKRNARTVGMLWQDEEYFVALTDTPGIRVGERGGTCFDFPEHHPAYRQALQSVDENTVQNFFEDCLDLYT